MSYNCPLAGTHPSNKGKGKGAWKHVNEVNWWDDLWWPQEESYDSYDHHEEANLGASIEEVVKETPPPPARYSVKQAAKPLTLAYVSNKKNCECDAECETVNHTTEQPSWTDVVTSACSEAGWSVKADKKKVKRNIKGSG